MRLILPKSYRVKHKILEFLSKERMKNGGLNPKEKWTFTLKQVSENIKEDYSDVHTQMDYFFYKKLVQFEKNDSELTNPYCWILDKGVESYSSFFYINEGKSLQTTLFNNLSTGFFQIIVGFVAVATILFNYSDSKLYHQEMIKLKRELQILKSDITIKCNKTMENKKNEKIINTNIINKKPDSIQTEKK